MVPDISKIPPLPQLWNGLDFDFNTMLSEPSQSTDDTNSKNHEYDWLPSLAEQGFSETEQGRQSIVSIRESSGGNVFPPDASHHRDIGGMNWNRSSAPISTADESFLSMQPLGTHLETDWNGTGSNYFTDPAGQQTFTTTSLPPSYPAQSVANQNTYNQSWF
jgi:hypothetical protein